jgi:hypothetical protein
MFSDRSITTVPLATSVSDSCSDRSLRALGPRVAILLVPRQCRGNGLGPCSYVSYRSRGGHPRQNLDTRTHDDTGAQR